MSSVSKSATEIRVPRPMFARVLLWFLGSMCALLIVASLLLGHADLPIYGTPTWNSAIELSRGVQYLTLVVDWTASEFPFITGALGTVWLTGIYLRVYRVGSYAPALNDMLLGVLAVSLSVLYFTRLDIVAPLNAGLLYRLALYCSIALMVFGVTVLLLYYADHLAKTGAGGTKGLTALTLIAFVVAGLASGGIGWQHAVIRYQLLNAGLHILTNVGAFCVGLGFYSEVTCHARTVQPSR